MASGSKNQHAEKGRSAGRGLPLKKKRVKYISLPLGYRASLRRFRTLENRRSKKNKQIVIQTNLFSLREIAVAKTRTTRKSKKQTILWIPRESFGYLLFIALVTNLAAGLALYSNRIDQVQLPHVASASAEPRPVKTAPPPKTMQRSKPVWLRIARIDVDSPLIYLDRNEDGSVQVPKVYDRAGWYKLSPTPGELGPAVIIGHVDSIGGVGVFWRVKELTTRDIIEVVRADGSTAKFKVTEIRQVTKDDFPTKDVYGNLDYAGLRLITCYGNFDFRSQQYDHNTIVFGKLI